MKLPDREQWRRLSPLLDELLDLAGAQRLGRLVELRARDATLADELASMLQALGDAEAAGFLSGRARHTAW